MLVMAWVLVVAGLGLVPSAAAGGEARDEEARPPAFVDALDQWEVGTTPGDWLVASENGGFVIATGDPEKEETGPQVEVGEARDRWLLLERDNPGNTIMQGERAIDAAAFRGGWVRYTARVARKGLDGEVWLTLRVEDAEGGVIGGGSSQDRGVRSGAWRVATVVAFVPEGAATLNVGVVSGGDCDAGIDDVRVEAVGEVVVPPEGPIEIDEGDVARLAAAARLWGVVRLFHPTREGLEAEWTRVTARLVREVLAAEDTGVDARLGAGVDARLGAALERGFAPVAPGLRVVREEEIDAEARATMRTRAEIPAEARWIDRAVVTGYVDPRTYADTGERRHPVYSYVVERVALTPMEGGGGGGGRGGGGGGGGGGGRRGPRGGAKVPPVWIDGMGRAMPAAEGVAWTDSELAFVPDYGDGAVRLAAVIGAWGTLSQVYPYMDVARAKGAPGGAGGAGARDWNGALERALVGAAAARDGNEFQRVLDVLLAELNDGHGMAWGGGGAMTRPLPVRAVWLEREKGAGEAAGEGAGWEGRELVVVAAEASTGLVAGDVIESINGVLVRDGAAEMWPRVSAATAQHGRTVLARRMLSVLGAQAMLGVRRADGGEATLRVAASATGEVPEVVRPANGTELAPGIVYFNLVGAGVRELRAQEEALAAARGVVFDVRGYPDQAATMLLPMLTDKDLRSARWNVPKWTRGFGRGVAWAESNWTLPPRKPRIAGKAAFLIDGSAISYAESIMEIVAHERLGRLVGEATAGTNGNVTTLVLPGGAGMQFTGMKVIKQDGSALHGVGVVPTDPVVPTRGGIAAGKDEVLERAVELLKADIAATP
jgi:C-terminal processing protease CtpA/Prc